MLHVCLRCHFRSTHYFHVAIIEAFGSARAILDDAITFRFDAAYTARLLNGDFAKRSAASSRLASGLILISLYLNTQYALSPCEGQLLSAFASRLSKAPLKGLRAAHMIAWCFIRLSMLTAFDDDFVLCAGETPRRKPPHYQQPM